MCGFLGKVSFNNFNENELLKSNTLIECRGPDSKIQETSHDGNIKYSYIFNRLSILDLSETANQPMFSEDESKILMFNGEIYNHTELRKDLKSKSINFFTKNSDSEVVLKGLMSYGPSFISRLRGQFSIYFHDKENKKIIISRDRLGQKPIYFFSDESNLIFGSNLLSLNQIINSSIDNDQISTYLGLSIIPSPMTIFSNINKVKPAETILIDYSKNKFQLASHTYWDIKDFIDEKDFNLEEFYDLFSESIDIRAKADVPIANFLSGGIDSTSIVKNLSDKSYNVNTFSVSVDNSDYDEKKWSQLVADFYKTNHKSINISSKIGINEIENSLKSLDEPYSDPSVVPSFLLSNEISKHYKVAISGDGADELLGGYKRVHNSLKQNSNINNLISKLYHLYPGFLGTGNLFLSLSSNKKTVYDSFLVDQKLVNLMGFENFNESVYKDINSSNYKNILYSEFKFFLSEMMLFKVDRTSMQNSIEVRSPFVDHKLVEYIFSHTTDYLNTNSPKAILKTYLESDLGKDFVNRKKKGFVFDIENWVFSNINYLNDVFKNGKVVNQCSPNLIRLLLINKSRINAHRVWKLYVLEQYLSRTD